MQSSLIVLLVLEVIFEFCCRMFGLMPSTVVSRELICNAITLSCPSSRPVAQKMGDNSGTSPSDLFQQLRAKRQQRPETPVLICRIHTSSSHHAPHQCSDSAEEWIRPGGKHQPRRKTAPPATSVAVNLPTVPTTPTQG